MLFVINRVISTIDVTLLNNENTKKLADKIDSAQRPLLNMSKIVDVSDGLKVEQISKLHATYISVTEEKLGAVRDKIIADALKDLVELKTTMRTPVLEEPDFYSWLFQTFDSATRGSTIRIVSMNEDLEWTDTPQEKKFFGCNVSAAKRGVRIERIFFFDKQGLGKSRDNQYIYAHRQGNIPNLIGRRVEATSFRQTAQTAVRDAGQGFILVDKKFVIVDVFSSDGKARGYVTFHEAEVAKYVQTFDRFSSLAFPLIYDSHT